MYIEKATPRHARGILDIYKPALENTAASFAVKAPSIDEIRLKIEHTIVRYPWLVYVVESQVAGYAYANIHRSREAYQWSVEPSVYVHPNHRNKGIGKSLYTTLFNILTYQNFEKAVAIITIPNEASIALHKSFGFEHVGVFKKAGYKLGKWHDTSWWELNLRNNINSKPKTIIPFKDIEKDQLNNLINGS